MHNYICGGQIKCIIPRGYLANIIRSAARGRFQKNKVNIILLRGYVRASQKESNLNKFDYEKSMKNLINRINKNLAPTGLYSMKYNSGYYYLSEDWNLCM